MKKTAINTAFLTFTSPLIEISIALTSQKDVRLFLLREDQLHPNVSGNKYRKLKYNLLAAEAQGQSTLLTFGGAFSNHIAAVAAAGKQFGFKTIGVIRGEQAKNLSPTLIEASEAGMQLHFISRSAYRQKEEPAFLTELQSKFGDCYIIPEGGTNKLAVKGCQEIWSNIEHHFTDTPNYVCTCVGTGGTIAGLITGNKSTSNILGFSALKGDFLTKEVSETLTDWNDQPYKGWSINNDYHFGGYAKHQPELIDFINDFKAKHNIALDPIYTGKMLFGILDLIKKDFFPIGSTILAIHTGGQQGIEGFNQRFGKLLS